MALIRKPSPMVLLISISLRTNFTIYTISKENTAYAVFFCVWFLPNFDHYIRITMTFFLATIFLIQIGVIFYFRYKMLSERRMFQSKLKPLEEFMTQLSSEQNIQSLQLKLSDDLKIKIKEINEALNKNVFELNYQLVEDSYPKKEN
jgi:hypothetical protein